MDTVRPETVRGFQTMFQEIYGARNAAVSNERLIAKVSEQAARVLKITCRDERTATPGALARLYAWTNAAANRLAIDLQDALWTKYPGICSYCLRQAQCMCGVGHTEIPKAEFRREYVRISRANRAGREPHTLPDHQALHRRLYQWHATRTLPIFPAAHIVEETMEVSEAFWQKNFEHMGEELADVVAWSFTLANRLDINFTDVLKKQFPNACAWCRVNPCRCTAPE